MSTVQVNAHLSEQATKALGQAVEQTALGTTSSANTMATALAPIAGELARVAGGALTTKAATEALSAAQNLTQATGTSLASSLKDITDTLLLYHEGTSQAASVSTSFFNAQSKLGVGVDRIAQTLQRLEPRIVGSRLSLNQLLGIVSQMTPIVGSGSRAMMQVGTVLQALMSPSATAQKALASLGVSLTDSSGHFVGYSAAIDRIKATLSKLPASTNDVAAMQKLLANQTELGTLALETQTKAVKKQETALRLQDQGLTAQSKTLSKTSVLYQLFGRQANIASALIAQGSAGLKANVAALTDTGTAASAAAVKQQDLSAQIETIKAAAATAGTALGTALIPAISQLVTSVMPVVMTITQWISKNPQLTAGILAAVAALGAMTAGAVALSAALDANPISLIIMGIAAVVALLAVAWAKDWGGIQEKTRAVMAALRPVFSALSSAIATVAKWIGDLFARISTNHDVLTGLQVAIRVLSTIISIDIDELRTFLGIWAGIFSFLVNKTPVMSILGAAVQAVAATFRTLWQAAENVVGAIQHVLNLAGQAAGAVGKIPGVGLASGVASNVTGAIGGILDHLPHFASGGMVSQPTLAIVGEAGPEAIIPTAGLSTAASSAQVGVQSASAGVSSSARALQLAQVRLTDAHERLTLAEDAHYKTLAARTKALESADLNLLRAEDALANAKNRLTLSHDKLALAERKLIDAMAKGHATAATRASHSVNGLRVPFGGAALDFTAVGKAPAFGAIGSPSLGAGQQPTVTFMTGSIVVQIDGKTVAATIAPDVSKILFDEERTYAGPINVMTGF